jgi:hypothetical protein
MAVGYWRPAASAGLACLLLVGGSDGARAAAPQVQLHFSFCSALAPAQRDFAAAASLLDDGPRRSLVRGDDYSGAVLGCAGQVRAKVCTREIAAFAGDLYQLHPAAPPGRNEMAAAAAVGLGAFGLSGGSLSAGLLGAAAGAGGAKILGMAANASAASWCMQQQDRLSDAALRLASATPMRTGRDVDLAYFQQLALSSVPGAEAEPLLAEASRRAAVLRRIFE